MNHEGGTRPHGGTSKPCCCSALGQIFAIPRAPMRVHEGAQAGGAEPSTGGAFRLTLTCSLVSAVPQPVAPITGRTIAPDPHYRHHHPLPPPPPVHCSSRCTTSPTCPSSLTATWTRRSLTSR